MRGLCCHQGFNTYNIWTIQKAHPLVFLFLWSVVKDVLYLASMLAHSPFSSFTWAVYSSFLLIIILARRSMAQGTLLSQDLDCQQKLIGEVFTCVSEQDIDFNKFLIMVSSPEKGADDANENNFPGADNSTSAANTTTTVADVETEEMDLEAKEFHKRVCRLVLTQSNLI
ncbi:uncharacterized protein LOC106012830 [Aplysia californica]|uniref:Uncharacterized protein LOC106012830 n=1 Tax=Aplysia californica TaxID=6500 RepID=A0ABM1A7L0_APLCA|nr:uncharacterized protein LOC106012830 [Aplysia californica]